MKKRITLPENIAEITLDQFQRFDKLNKRTDLNDLSYNKRVIEIFTELKYKDIGNVSHKDYEVILETINSAMNKEVKFVDRFKMNDIEFGFIPDFDDMTTGEYMDLTTIGLEVENLHKLMAVLFRPITNKDFLGNYSIASYEGTKEYANVMKFMPMHIVNGALVFFYNLARELRLTIQKSTTQVQQRVQKLNHILKSGDGMLHSMN